MKKMSEVSHIDFIRRKFAEYYSKNSNLIQPPTAIKEREYGFLLFEERMMIRHKGFKDASELRHFINVIIPSHIYYSAAYYERPEDPMDSKGWLGADLIFDIDADHIPTRCKTEHDVWRCQNCKTVERGEIPEACPRCGGVKIEGETWLCDTCLEAAKAETLKLIDFLTDDFGFSKDEIDVCFSGHRGFHVHVESDSVKTLDQMARKEIVDYISGTGLKAKFHGLREKREKNTREVIGPDLYDPGWRGRLARGVYDFLIQITPEQLERIEGLKKNTINTIMQKREVFLEAWRKKTPWEAVKGVGIRTWNKITQYAIKKQAAIIDTVVSTDVHRLIRMPTTLHGKTGLKAIKIPIDYLESFDPLRDSIAFKDSTITVYVNEAHQFRLGEQIYGPYEAQIVDLPEAAAIYLICKGVAKPVGG